MIDVSELRFDADGLIPVVVTDARTKDVLTLAYMNRESVRLSMLEERTVFWSRSRRALWRKGETSGNVQHLVSLTADCDRDALVAEVEPDGPACHLGNASCFSFPLWHSTQRESFDLRTLEALLAQRRRDLPEGSYTTYLFEKGLDKILKKVGEESAEVLLAAKGGDRAETVYELADLAYHLMVLMAQADISVEDVRKELASRHIIDHKIKQEKMT